MSLRIGAFTTDWSHQRPIEGVTFKTAPKYGGTCWYRIAMPGYELAKHGHSFVLGLTIFPAPDGSLAIEDIHGERHFGCDVIWLQRWMHREAPHLIRQARATGQVVIQDVDDHFWGLPTTNVAFINTHPKSNPDFNRDHYWAAIAASDGITCSTQYLADRVAKLHRPTFVCRNAIDLARWAVNDVGDEQATAGWVGGIPWRGSDLQILRGVIGPYLEAHDFAFYHGGHTPDPNFPSAVEQLGIDPTKVKCSTAPLVDIADYPSLWTPLDISLIPLDDIPFNHGKSHLKALDSSAAGVPWIAPAWHEEYQWFSEHKYGRLAKRADQWRKHLEALADPVTRKTEGAMARERAEREDISLRWVDWEAAFDQIVASR